MSVERFKIAALPVNFGKLLANSPLGGAVAGAGIGGLTSLLSGDDHAVRDMALGAGAGALHGNLGQRATALEQHTSGTGPIFDRITGVNDRTQQLAQRLDDMERARKGTGQVSSALDRLSRLVKGANLATILPTVAVPALGGFAGRAIGARYNRPDIGMLLGGIAGGTTGQLLRERAEAAQHAESPVPSGAPYALDASSQDIPTWALQGAQLLQSQMKQGAHKREPIGDVLKGEVPGYPVAEAAFKHGPGAAARTFGGMAGGGLVGGGLGALGAMGIEKLLGRQIDVPGIHMSLPDLLASVGGTIGATKGMRLAKVP